MAQGIYDKLQETYKLLKSLNNKLCCDNPFPNLTTTTTNQQFTTTTTLPNGFFRASWLTEIVSVLRPGFITTRVGWYDGNTVANVTAANPTFEVIGVTNGEDTGGVGITSTRTLRETIASPAQVISPTYTTFDTITNMPLLKDLRQFYDYTVKLVNNSFLSTRNPSVFIKRVFSPNGGGSGVPHDGYFLIGVDFDATGLEIAGYDIYVQYYNHVPLPGNVVVPFAFSSYYGSSISAVDPSAPMTLDTPSTSWVNGVTFIPTVACIVQEDFPIPPGW